MEISKVVLGLVPLVAQERVERIQQFLIQPMRALTAFHHLAKTLKGNP